MIIIEQITKSFDGTKAVDGVSLRVADGETLGIVGPSGSGKTTLLRLVAGLEVPDAGEIHIDGRCASAPGRLIVEPHARSIGFVFQRPALWPHMTVAQNCLFGMADMNRQEAARRVGELLEAAGLAAMRSRRPDTLSAGQARRVALARALAPRPRHLLMDEPLTNLDADNKAEMLRLILSCTRNTGATLIYVSHDAAEVREVAARVVRIRGGRMESPADGPGGAEGDPR